MGQEAEDNRDREKEGAQGQMILCPGDSEGSWAEEDNNGADGHSKHRYRDRY